MHEYVDPTVRKANCQFNSSTPLGPVRGSNVVGLVSLFVQVSLWRAPWYFERYLVC